MCLLLHSDSSHLAKVSSGYNCSGNNCGWNRLQMATSKYLAIVRSFVHERLQQTPRSLAHFAAKSCFQISSEKLQHCALLIESLRCEKED